MKFVCVFHQVPRFLRVAPVQYFLRCACPLFAQIPESAEQRSRREMLRVRHARESLEQRPDGARHFAEVRGIGTKILAQHFMLPVVFRDTVTVYVPGAQG